MLGRISSQVIGFDLRAIFGSPPLYAHGASTVPQAISFRGGAQRVASIVCQVVKLLKPVKAGVQQLKWASRPS